MSESAVIVREPELATPTDGGDIDHLDFDYAVECEKRGCDKAAEYRMVKACCEKVYLFCEKDTVAFGALNKHVKNCMNCSQPHKEQVFSAVEKF